MTESRAENTKTIVMVLTLGGFVLVAASVAIWMGYLPFFDQSITPTVAGLLFVGGLMDLGLALYFKNRGR